MVSDGVAARAHEAAVDFMWELAAFKPSPEDLAALDTALGAGGGAVEVAALLARNIAFLLHPLVVRKLLLLRDAADGALVLRSKSDAAALALLGKDVRDVGQVQDSGRAGYWEKQGDEARRDLLTALAPLLSGGGRGAVARAFPEDLRRDFYEARYFAREARKWALQRRRETLRDSHMEAGSALRGNWRFAERDVAILAGALGTPSITTHQLGLVVAALCGHRGAESRATFAILAIWWGREAATLRRWIAELRPPIDGEDTEAWIAERLAACPSTGFTLNGALAPRLA